MGRFGGEREKDLFHDGVEHKSMLMSFPLKVIFAYGIMASEEEIYELIVWPALALGSGPRPTF